MDLVSTQWFFCGMLLWLVWVAILEMLTKTGNHTGKTSGTKANWTATCEGKFTWYTFNGGWEGRRGGMLQGTFALSVQSSGECCPEKRGFWAVLVWNTFHRYRFWPLWHGEIKDRNLVLSREKWKSTVHGKRERTRSWIPKMATTRRNRTQWN